MAYFCFTRTSMTQFQYQGVPKLPGQFTQIRHNFQYQAEVLYRNPQVPAQEVKSYYSTEYRTTVNALYVSTLSNILAPVRRNPCTGFFEVFCFFRRVAMVQNVLFCRLLKIHIIHQHLIVTQHPTKLMKRSTDYQHTSKSISIIYFTTTIFLATPCGVSQKCARTHEWKSCF